MSYSWPGNVRPLENAVEMAVALSGDRGMLYVGDFPLPAVLPSKTVSSNSPVIALPDEGLDFEQIVSQMERTILEQACEEPVVTRHKPRKCQLKVILPKASRLPHNMRVQLESRLGEKSLSAAPQF